MTQDNNPAPTALVEREPADATTMRKAPSRRMRSFWWLVALTATMLAVLIGWAVLEMRTIKEVTGEQDTVPAQQSPSTVYGQNGEIPGAFLRAGVPERNPSRTYGNGGEVPDTFTADPQPDDGGSYGPGGEIPDTFTSADIP